MKRPGRVSMRAALMTVAGLALVLAAMRSSSDVWWLAMWLAKTLLLSWATLGALVLRGRDRTPWLGMALFGWLYFAMTHENRYFPDYTPEMRRTLNFLADSVHPDPPLAEIAPSSSVDEVSRVTMENEARSAASRSRRDNFTTILLMLLSLAFMMVGGLAGRSFAAKMRTDPPLASRIGYNREKEAP